MNKRLKEKVAKAMYECCSTGGDPPWEEALDTTRDWLQSRAEAAIEAVEADLSQFVKRNLTDEAATIGQMLVSRFH